MSFYLKVKIATSIFCSLLYLEEENSISLLLDKVCGYEQIIVQLLIYVQLYKKWFSIVNFYVRAPRKDIKENLSKFCWSAQCLHFCFGYYLLQLLNLFSFDVDLFFLVCYWLSDNLDDILWNVNTAQKSFSLRIF